MEGGAKLSAGGGPFIFRLSIALSDASSAEARDKPKLFRQAAPRCPLRVGLSTNGTSYIESCPGDKVVRSILRCSSEEFSPSFGAIELSFGCLRPQPPRAAIREGRRCVPMPKGWLGSQEAAVDRDL